MDARVFSYSLNIQLNNIITYVKTSSRTWGGSLGEDLSLVSQIDFFKKKVTPGYDVMLL